MSDPELNWLMEEFKPRENEIVKEMLDAMEPGDTFEGKDLEKLIRIAFEFGVVEALRQAKSGTVKHGTN